jgi:membrane protease YdiL (CAAX protease family)
MLYKKIDLYRYIKIGKLKHVVSGLCLGVAVWILSVFLTSILSELFGSSVTIGETNQIITLLTKDYPATVILFTLLPGICEEFAFRVFLQNALKSKYSFFVALFGASLAFGLFHPDPQATYTIITFVVGAIFGYFYERYQSYIMTATAHTAFNSVTIILFFVFV